jgi:hypothetical protein
LGYPLSSIIRRIREHMYTILITVGMAFIPTALAVLVWAYDHNNPPSFMLLAIVLGVMGFASWSKAIDLARRDDNAKKRQAEEQMKQTQALIDEIKGLREDLKRQGR